MENDDEKLTHLRTSIKALIAENKLEEATLQLLAKLVLHSEVYDSVILISAKYKRIEKFQHLNTVSFQELEREIVKLENGLMYLLKNLKPDDLR